MFLEVNLLSITCKVSMIKFNSLMNLNSMMLNQNFSYNGFKHIEQEYLFLFYKYFFPNII
jgi:hypothetical protein